MKINFTKKEYKHLVTMIGIADWVINAHHVDVQHKECRSLIAKILSYAKEMGMGDCYVKDGDEYYETREYEEKSEKMAFIQEYEEQVFWEELISKLVDRDYHKKYGGEEADFSMRIERYTKMEHMYADEVNEHGIKNLNFNKVK